MEQYNEFNFWRPVLPDIELELSQCGALPSSDSMMEISDSLITTSNHQTKAQQDESQYNEFNFWKSPLPDIQIEFAGL